MVTEYLKPKDVAERLGVSESTIKRELEKGKLRGIKVGKLWRIHPADLEAYTGRKAAPKKLTPDDPEWHRF